MRHCAVRKAEAKKTRQPCSAISQPSTGMERGWSQGSATGVEGKGEKENWVGGRGGRWAAGGRQRQGGRALPGENQSWVWDSFTTPQPHDVTAGLTHPVLWHVWWHKACAAGSPSITSSRPEHKRGCGQSLLQPHHPLTIIIWLLHANILSQILKVLSVTSPHSLKEQDKRVKASEHWCAWGWSRW